MKISYKNQMPFIQKVGWNLFLTSIPRKEPTADLKKLRKRADTEPLLFYLLYTSLLLPIKCFQQSDVASINDKRVKLR